MISYSLLIMKSFPDFSDITDNSTNLIGVTFASVQEGRN